MLCTYHRKEKCSNARTLRLKQKVQARVKGVTKRRKEDVQGACVNENKYQLKLKSSTWLHIPCINTFKIEICKHATNAIDLTAQVLDVHR